MTPGCPKAMDSRPNDGSIVCYMIVFGVIKHVRLIMMNIVCYRIVFGVIKHVRSNDQ